VEVQLNAQWMSVKFGSLDSDVSAKNGNRHLLVGSSQNNSHFALFFKPATGFCLLLPI